MGLDASVIILGLIEGGSPSEPTEAVERAHERSGVMTAGCNPAHRRAPLAMAPFRADCEIAGCALREVRLTHRHPLAGDVAAALAALCRALIRGGSWCDALATAKIGRLRPTDEGLDEEDSHPLSPGGSAPEVLRASAHSVTRNESFAEALGDSLDFAGPANYGPGPGRGHRRGGVGSGDNSRADAPRLQSLVHKPDDAVRFV